MTRLKREPIAVVAATAPVVAVLAGTTAALAGLYLLAGLAATLIVGGVLVAVAGLVVDLG